MQILLDRDMLLRLFCYSQEAARSVHRGHGGDWSGLRKYYHADKRAGVRQLIDRLQEAVGAVGPNELVPTREELDHGTPELGLLRYLLGGWIARWKKTWSFPVPVIRFTIRALQALLCVLDEQVKPEPKRLMELRMDLSYCSCIFEGHCFGLPELERARKMDHFDRTEWLPFVTLADIVGEEPPATRPVRRSA